MRSLFAASIALAAAACSSEDAMVVTRARDGGAGDTIVVEDTAPADAFDAETDARDPNLNCVKPGDPGNELGVGAYCEQQSDCKRVDGGPPLLCTSKYTDDPYAWFCTTLCTATGIDPKECGTGVVCVDNPLGSGCVPLSCAGDDAGTDADAD